MLEVFLGCLQKGGDGNTLLNIGVYYLSASRVGWPSSPITRTSHDKQSLGVGGDTTIWPSKWGTPNEADRGILVFMMVGETSSSAISKFFYFLGVDEYHTKNIHQSPSFFHTAIYLCCQSNDCWLYIFIPSSRCSERYISTCCVFFWNLGCLTWNKRTDSTPGKHLQIGVSKNRGTPKTPQNDHF